MMKAVGKMIVQEWVLPWRTDERMLQVIKNKVKNMPLIAVRGDVDATSRKDIPYTNVSRKSARSSALSSDMPMGELEFTVRIFLGPTVGHRGAYGIINDTVIHGLSTCPFLHCLQGLRFPRERS